MFTIEVMKDMTVLVGKVEAEINKRSLEERKLVLFSSRVWEDHVCEC